MKKEKLKVEDVYKDFRASAQAHRKLHEEMQKDMEFTLGKQWKEEDVRKLESIGVNPQTVNKISQKINLITGIERQSRTDYKAFPEGEEDSLIADISTILLKHALKEGRGQEKQSEQFEEGVITGACYLEPYIDYTYDILNGDLRIRKLSATRVFPDPDFEEKDLSDADYIIKFSPELSEGQVLELFPEHEKYFKNIGSANIDMTLLNDTGKDISAVLPQNRYKDDGDDVDIPKERTFDLIDYYYKNTVKRFFVANKKTGEIQEFESKSDAEDFIDDRLLSSTPDEQIVTDEDFIVIERFVPEIRLAQVVGDKILSDEVASTFPKWKSFPLIPFFAKKMTYSVKDKELLIQGITRQLRPLQVELNLLRTAANRHLRQSANSGWLTPKGAWVNPNDVAQFGSLPGVSLEYNPDKGKPERIFPAPLSQGHEQLALDNTQDMKDTSGVNSDLLANESQSQSGKAILAKQKQGMVMIQTIVDNYQFSKLTFGRFLLSQLGELFTVEKAMKVVGEAFIKKNFEKPQIDEQTGEPIVDENNKLVMDVDQEEVALAFNKILNDAQLGKYEVSLGEGIYSETVQLSNYLTLVDLAEKGLPIPPDVLIDESTLSKSSKGKIINALQNAQQQGAV